MNKITDPFNCVILNKPVSLHLEPNQIKGKSLKGQFVKNDLHEVKINGNGQLAYFSTEEKNKGTMK